ncbi:hypothetical protein [Pseudoalteromonas sp. S16_S37]|uniref:hypothetical protein n=1 Tax=Pseudoalteromonas sp. S16_S37 TaxID=2720228 RepID=UPI00193195FD|nr:hypothetical protein [Pseudoalteromonas sp. S16_S37]
MAKLPMPEFAWVSEMFPLISNGKLLDQDVLVHSLGCSVWNTFGHEQSFMAMVECPAPGTFGADIRSDSGWFDKASASPLCLIEFERFDGSIRGQQKLEEKLKNLLEAAQRWGHSPKTLVLSAWSQGLVSAPDTQKLKEICRSGFTSSTGTFVQSDSEVEVVFSRFLFVKNLNSIALDRIHYEVLI